MAAIVTETIDMTGSHIAVAGAGPATFTPHRRAVDWFFAGADADAPETTHTAGTGHDVNLDVPADTFLYLRGPSGAKVTVTRQTSV